MYLHNKGDKIIHPKKSAWYSSRRMLCVMFLMVLTSQISVAQGDCATAIQLTDLDNWCSADGAYITYPAASGYAQPSCWGAINRETWFQFTAVATYVHISVYGASYGGSLQRPEIALYSGTCGGTINERKCTWAPSGVNYAEIFNGGLTVGETYLIRVDGINNPEKNFRLCINNYNTTSQPGQDCNTALYLCTQQDISLEFQPGPGTFNDEATNTCMDGFNDPFLEPSETNSIWVKWECGVAGTLTFVIEPTQVNNDLDWCLFELPNGINDCSVKNDIRCNSSACLGATGMDLTSIDLVEDPNCDIGEDLFVRYVDMPVGQAYALVINNFTSGQDGFTLSFGGTGGFKDLQADFSMVQSCANNDITFTDNSTNAVQWDWVFGPGAVPSTANTPGPHVVTYPPGNHTAVLTITDVDGCTDFEYINFDVPAGAVTYTTSITDVTCASAGEIDVTITSGSSPYEYSNDGGSTFTAPIASGTHNWSGLAPGSYDIVVQDAGGCTSSSTVTVGSSGTTSITNVNSLPEDCNGLNGSITVNISGSDPPYEYSNDGGSTYSAATAATTFVFPGLANGSYDISVRDNNGCVVSQSGVSVAEQNTLNLVSAIPVSATCGSSNGSIGVTLSGGTPPYEFSSDNGSSFSAPQAGTFLNITGLASGNYTIIGRDDNGCTVSMVVNVASLGGIAINSVSPGNANCTSADGTITVVVAGGTPPYQFSSDGGTTFSAAQASPTYIFTGLVGGNYTIEVRDNNSCIASQGTTVMVNDLATSQNFPESICSGDSLLFNGSYYTSQGSYPVILTNSFGCDSTLTLDLTILPLTSGTDAASICPGDSYTMPLGEVISNAGVYTDTIAGFNCDSVVTVTITQLSNAFGFESVSICPGEMYVMPLGESISSAGVYLDTLPGFECDSIITVSITQLSNSNGVVTVDLCPGESYIMPLGESISSAGVFVDTLAGFECDSIVTVTINTLSDITQQVAVSICPGEAYTMPLGELITTAGIFTDTLAGFTCDSIVEVTVSLLSNSFGSDAASLCPGDSYTMPLGEEITSSGVFIDTIAGFECDSIVTVTITLLPNTIGSASADICPGESYVMPLGEVITAGGVYVDTIAGFECDSIVTITVNLLSNSTGSATASICPGETYTMPAGEIISTGGVFTDTIAGFECDSIVTVTITQLSNSFGVDSVAICPGQTHTLPSGTLVSSGGLYTDTIAGFLCDSIITVTVIDLVEPTTNLTVGICTGQSYSINGIDFYNATGIYTDTLAGFQCDSIVTVNLIVSDFSLTILEETLCDGDSASINGIDYFNSTGVYADTLAGVDCDSIVVLNLTVVIPPQTTLNQTICEGEQFVFNGNSYSATGIYIDTLAGTICDSIVTLNLAVNTVTLTNLVTTNENCNGIGGQVGFTLMGAIPPFNYAVTDSLGNTTIYNTASIDLDKGSYTVSITDSIGCSIDTSFVIDIDLVEGIEVFPSFESIFLGESILLETSSSSGSFQWSPATFLSCDTCSSTTSTPDYSLMYIIYNDRNGCISADTVFIEVRQPDTFIPSAFSPNGDNHNDVLYVIDEHIQELIFFKIYNRWGEQLFGTSDISVGWDGSYKAKTQEMDTYIYHLRLMLYSDEVIEVSGPVLLMR